MGRIDGKRSLRPETWATSAEGELCLGCRRDLAGEAALDDAAAKGTDRSVHSKLRRAALIEFELRRTPELNDRMIAKACHCSSAAVRAVRRRLGEPEEA